MVDVLLNENVDVQALTENVLNATFGDGDMIKELVTVCTQA